MSEHGQSLTCKSAGRKLVKAPVLLQDWDEEGEEQSARYWELFVDLLLVATASVVADGLKEDPTPEGVSAFVCLYLIFLYGWNTYLHLTTRFEDSSLLHSFNLFFFLLGTAAMVMNAYEFHNVRAFAISACIQRVSLIVMYLSVAKCIPRARGFCLLTSAITTAGVICLAMSAIINTETSARYLWWLAALIETNLESFVLAFQRGRRLVPVNIEHNVERFGCLVLVMLGETVLSVTLNYRVPEEEEEHGATFSKWAYYKVMAYSFLLIFMFALLFFHMEPSRKDHAFHRSRTHGLLYLFAFKTLGLALLSIGVGIKLIVESVLESEPLTIFASGLMGISVGVALTTLFILRVLHYGGKLPRRGDPPDARRIMIAWWYTFAFAAVLPFIVCLILVRGGWRDPTQTLGIYALILTILCVVETCYSHVLEPHLAKPLTEDPEVIALTISALEQEQEKVQGEYSTFAS